MNPAPNSAVTPIADGGAGRFTWERSKVADYYRIRRGSLWVGSVSLHANLSRHAQVLNDICRVLDQHEGAPE